MPLQHHGLSLRTRSTRVSSRTRWERRKRKHTHPVDGSFSCCKVGCEREGGLYLKERRIPPQWVGVRGRKHVQIGLQARGRALRPLHGHHEDQQVQLLRPLLYTSARHAARPRALKHSRSDSWQLCYLVSEGLAMLSSGYPNHRVASVVRTAYPCRLEARGTVPCFKCSQGYMQ
jgi:hypothetical protein